MSNEEGILEEETIADERSKEARRLGTAILQRPIRGLSTLKAPLCVAPETTVRDAIERMSQGRVGCVLVESGGRLVGVFTERDVLTRVVGKGLDAARTSVEAVMTSDPECLSLDDGVPFALNKMSLGGFRHIPLIDEQGRPTGVVAMRNIVDYIVDLFPREVLNLPPSTRIGARTREGA